MAFLAVRRHAFVGGYQSLRGLVKPDLSVKAWGRKFQQLAHDLRELKLPAVQFVCARIGRGVDRGQGYLKQAHQTYVEAIGHAIVKP